MILTNAIQIYKSKFPIKNVMNSINNFCEDLHNSFLKRYGL